MDTPTLLVIIGLLLTNAGFLFGMWKYFDARILRVYLRFGEHKATIENTYVRQGDCKLLHNNTADNLKGVDSRINIRFDKLESKVENNFAMVLDLLREFKANGK